MIITKAVYKEKEIDRPDMRTLIGFVLGKTKKLREAFMQVPKSSTELFHDKVEVPIKQGPVYQLRITADERLFLVGVAGGLVLVYAAKDVLEKVNMQVLHRFGLSWVTKVMTPLEGGRATCTSFQRG